ncbi:ATP-binding protein [Amycolatopsis anabasis]|uniref:ATP-binding protein n=1 Tax=Amycolatopsis anabasis TaxID=1840409 RepID=UPI00131D6E0F|nr:tetratricopeptide repeat protein [Amycolatopsis anabasis]
MNRERGQRSEISGDVTGPVVQAGAVHGDVHVHHGTGEPVRPRQLLPPPARFAGRAAEVAALDRVLAEPGTNSSPVVVLKGPGGVGKTALALHWLDGLADRYPDGQLYADLAHPTGEPVAPEDVLGQFVRSLGVAPQRVPAGLTERTGLYRSVTAGRELIVLLDNAVSAGQARVLLPASPRGLTVVTSRYTLLGLLADGAHVVPVAPLDEAGSLDLLASRIGDERMAAERPTAEALAELCGGLPIALCVAGARVAARPRRSLANLAAELADERERLDALSAKGDLSVRSTFDVAYAGLDSRLRHLYRTLGLHPGGTFRVEVVAAMVRAAPRPTRDALEELVDASLLEELDEGRYRFHDLIRVHALEQALADEDEETRTATIHRAVTWYLFAAQAADRAVMPARRVLTHDFGAAAEFPLPADLDQHSAALGWLEAERPNLIAATREAMQRDWFLVAYHLADALQPLFILHRHGQDAIEIGELALNAARQLDDPVAEKRVRKRLARVYTALGQTDRAERHISDLLLLSQERGDRRGEASALKSRGLLFAEAGRFAEAARVLARTVDILRGLGKRRGEALALINLGETLVRLGEHESAVVELGRARELLTSLHVPDPYNEARAARALGQAHLAGGNLEAADELLRHALVVFADQGADHERGRTHRALADLCERTGKPEESRQHAEAAGTFLDLRPR